MSAASERADFPSAMGQSDISKGPMFTGQSSLPSYGFQGMSNLR